MKNWAMRWLANILALLFIVLGYYVTKNPSIRHFNTAEQPGIWIDTPAALFTAVVALALANSVVRPIVMFFAWPLNCVTFGLFSFVLNVILFYVVGHLNLGFHVNGPYAALIGSVAMGILSGVINFFLADKGEKRKR